MNDDWITLTPEELKKYLPENTTEKMLKEIAENISSYLNTTKARINKLRKKKEEYKHIAKARKKLEEAMEALKQGKDGFSPEIYSLLIDNEERDKEHKLLLEKAGLATGSQRRQLFHEAYLFNKERPPTLKHQIDSVTSCMPKEEPKSIEKKALEYLFEIMHLECEKAKANMGWYSRDYVSGGHKGDFFLLCQLALDKINQPLAEATIQKYISKTSKPNREKMRQVYKNLNGDVTLAKIWQELDNLNS